MGSGVRTVSAPSRTSAMPPCAPYHFPRRQKYSFASTQPFGMPLVPEVNSTAHSSAVQPCWRIADVRIDRHDRGPEGVERQPMKEEVRVVFDDEGNARAVTEAGAGVTRSSAL